MGGRKAKNMLGFTNGRLRVLKQTESKNRQSMWVCICDCGKQFTTSGAGLRRGAVLSCGCLKKSLLETHGMYNTAIYSSWIHMKQRCNNENFKQYQDYGGRGISYDPKWETFEGFFEDMMEGHSDNLTLDRIDTNGNYNKENCKWSTRQEQSSRQRLNKRNKSGRSGVYQATSGKWVAEIRVNYKKISLGRYETYEEACKVKSEAEMKYFGFIKE